MAKKIIKNLILILFITIMIFSLTGCSKQKTDEEQLREKNISEIQYIDNYILLMLNNINNIELVNLSDSVTTMYPMLNDNFEEIASAVKINGSTQNITYSADSKYTSSMILSGIKAALDKAVVTGAK